MPPWYQLIFCAAIISKFYGTSLNIFQRHNEPNIHRSLISQLKSSYTHICTTPIISVLLHIHFSRRQWHSPTRWYNTRMTRGHKECGVKSYVGETAPESVKCIEMNEDGVQWQ
jgi:hypothetical protein